MNECVKESSDKEIKVKISKEGIPIGKLSAYNGECNIFIIYIIQYLQVKGKIENF